MDGEDRETCGNGSGELDIRLPGPRLGCFALAVATDHPEAPFRSNCYYLGHDYFKLPVFMQIAITWGTTTP